MKLATLKRWKRDALEDAFDKKASPKHARRIAALISEMQRNLSYTDKQVVLNLD